MGAGIRIDRTSGHARLLASGAFDLANAAEVSQAVAAAEATLGEREVEIDLGAISRIDGAGAVLLARLADRVEASGRRVRVEGGPNANAAGLIALYRERSSGSPSPAREVPALARLGSLVAGLPASTVGALDFVGRTVGAFTGAIVSPASVNWRSLPRLVQAVGADGLPVTSAANLLVGVIIGFLGVSQLGRFGATVYVPELVVVAHFRELGPLVTAIVVAGRSGAGLASEIATMKVSEEIDALRVMGFDPMRWLVVPRCLALMIAMPLLTWVGDLLALVGGLVATTTLTDMPARTYVTLTASVISPAHMLAGLAKSPFLGLAIGLIACGQGLATWGGAAAVGSRTTMAVVIAIFGVIVISSLFTFLFAFLGV